MDKASLDLLNKKIEKQSKFVLDLKKGIGKVIVGQDELINKILISIISNGHILLEGVPGLAKTLTINTIANLINADFKRIQFTPDMLPADLIGTLIYNQKTGDFVTKKGPIFSNIILADEINRAPSKVQSALLESMQERQVTIGENTFVLSETLSKVLNEINIIKSQNMAVAVNEEVVEKINWENYKIKSGDIIEIVQPLKGG